MNYLEVNCPCCQSKLVIDTDLGRILSHKKRKTKVDSFEEFFSKEKEKEDKLSKIFEEGQKKEKEKIVFLEKKIEIAKKQSFEDADEFNSDKRILWD